MQFEHIMKKGFTLVEMLVGGLILVIAMALIGVLYSKAAKIRIIITGETYIQQVANQMMDTIISGGGNPLEGLRCATRIYKNGEYGITHDIDATHIVFGNINKPFVRIDILDPASEKTVKKGTKSGSSPSSGEISDLDFNNKIDIVNTTTNNSCFRYYDENDVFITNPDTNRDDIAKIIICLAAKSSLSAISRTIILYNSVTIRNIYHID